MGHVLASVMAKARKLFRLLAMRHLAAMGAGGGGASHDEEAGGGKASGDGAASASASGPVGIIGMDRYGDLDARVQRG